MAHVRADDDRPDLQPPRIIRNCINPLYRQPPQPDGQTIEIHICTAHISRLLLQLGIQ